MWKRPSIDSRQGAEQSVTNPSSLAESPSVDPVQQLMHELSPDSDDYATLLTDRVLHLATQHNASDVHFDAHPDGYVLRLRVNGTLREIGCVPHGVHTNMPGRIKSLARLLTYRSNIPQEGRLTFGQPRREARVVTFPTLHGERLVIRLVAPQARPWRLQDIGLSGAELARHELALSASAGVVIITGSVGTGKTTSAYAALRWLAAPEQHKKHAAYEQHEKRAGRCVVTLEDPIESELPGVAQAQIDPAVGFDWVCGLRSLLRQDPEVIFIGEIRDAQTAQLAFRASMTGQLVVTTMHARSACEALLRLLDMQVPSQHLLSGLRLLTCQRLVPQRCDCENGCQACEYSGFSGRRLQVEMLPELEGELARVALNGCDLQLLQQAAVAQGWRAFEQLAEEEDDNPITSPRGP